MTGQWQLWAQRDPDPVDGREFFHFGARRWVTMCYGGDVVLVHLVEDPDGTYWGWDDATDGLTMVQPHHGMYTVQFAYGPEAEEEAGNGRTVRLRVELLGAPESCDTCGTAPPHGGGRRYVDAAGLDRGGCVDEHACADSWSRLPAHARGRGPLVSGDER